ncbi:multidrug and toxin extrusion protein 1 isoform X1 [Salvelinus fontinalis]|uniref:multidrug and toxin extrusion protein 1 isoform X1 n=1 Tax=Salvelinus fontinalis TaxID=8038 RepID=UPI0024860235|nr:multidrug and toxin extrusion protein 1 isoform X1 [Salvelinus fontinalis]
MEKAEFVGSLPGPGLVAGDVVALSEVVRGTGEEPAEAVVSSRLFRCVSVRRWIPLAYREELYHVLRLTGPLLVARILNFLLPFVITIFCGHLGNAELAGYALGSAVINVTTTSTGYGLALACDTLVSQTFGSSNLLRVGVILQRAVLILLLFCLPCWGLLINAHNILLAMNQEQEVARIAQLYVMLYLPAVPAMFLHQLQTAYLQNQGIILPQMYTAAAANLINLAVNYILLFSLEMGVIGSAIANSLSQITICLLLYLYICWRGLHKNTWAGWSREALQEWGSYMQLAIPSTLMVCFEWWVWEIGGFLAGMLGEVDLAAQHVLLEIGAITYMFPLGVHAAACVRVGNALGAGDTSRALLTCKVALVLSGVLAVFQGIAIGSSRHVLGYIFTSDQAIVDNVSVNLGLYTFIQFFDALLCVCSGILVGAGKQKIAALSNLVSYYCVGLPVGIALMFAAKLRILGLWVGLLFCVILQTGFFLVIIFKLNWQQVAKEAQVRAGKSGLVTCVPAKPPIGQPLIQTLLPEGSRSTDTAQPESDESKPPGYTPVSTQGGVASGVEQQEGPGVQSKGLLSASQLVLRRGFTLLTALFLLATGVAVHLACPPPAPSIHSLSNLTLDWTNSSTPTTPLELTSPL